MKNGASDALFNYRGGKLLFDLALFERQIEEELGDATHFDPVDRSGDDDIDRALNADIRQNNARVRQIAAAMRRAVHIARAISADCLATAPNITKAREQAARRLQDYGQQGQQEEGVDDPAAAEVIEWVHALAGAFATDDWSSLAV